MKRILPLALLAVSAVSLHARPAPGIYDFSPEGCASEFSDGRLEVMGDTIYGMESSCRMTNPTSIRDMPNATLYDMVCSGEGSEWTYRAFIANDYDGSLLRYSEGGFTRYLRCN